LYHTCGFFEVKNSSGIHIGHCAPGALLVIALLWSCAETPITGSPLEHARLKDGTYQGSYRGGPNKARVTVIVKDRKIAQITIDAHQAWRGKKAEVPVVARIIAAQSTRVDAVSGATNSSRVIMNAVQKALEKAYRK